MITLGLSAPGPSPRCIYFILYFLTNISNPIAPSNCSLLPHTPLPSGVGGVWGWGWGWGWGLGLVIVNESGQFHSTLRLGPGAGAGPGLGGRSQSL